MCRYRSIFSIKNYILISLCIFQYSAYANNTELVTVSNELLSKAKAEGRIKVIVNLKEVGDLSMDSTKKLSNKNRLASISKVQDKVLKRLHEHKGKPLEVTKYRFTPQLALSVTETGLTSLAHDSSVASISEDTLLQGSLGESVPKIFSSYKTSDYSGKNWAVAILDTGVDINHSAFQGRVIREACYSSGTIVNPDSNLKYFNNYYSLCPGSAGNANQKESSIPALEGPGSGVDCTDQLTMLRNTLPNLGVKNNEPTGTGCGHGTTLAGIAAGNFGNMQGVARDAKIIAIQVFTAVVSDNSTPDDKSDDTIGVTAFTSDVMKGLEKVYNLAGEGVKIAAVNLSLNGLDASENRENHTFNSEAECNNAMDNNSKSFPKVRSYSSVIRPWIKLLKERGVATIAATGNNDAEDGVNAWACIDEAIAVGAVDDNDKKYDFCNHTLQFDPNNGKNLRHTSPALQIKTDPNTNAFMGLERRNCGSNSGKLLDLWAPGVNIVTAKAGGGLTLGRFGNGVSGTSEAAPHVAGAWAVMKESNPSATVDEIEMAFKSTGKDITVGGVTRKRIDIDKALTAMAGGSCQSNFGLTPDQWTMISLPCMPPSNKNTVQDIFGDDGLGEYDTHWVVYSYDNGSNPSAYKKEGLSTVLGQGKGYWILTTTKNATVDMPEGSLDTPNLVSSNSQACMSRKGCFEIPIAAKGAKLEWNLLGNPYLFPESKLSEVRIVTDVATAPNNCADANGCTLDEAKSDGIFHNKLWSWTYSGKPANGKYLMLSPTNSLKPWMAAWAASLKNATGTNPRLLIPNKAP
jgi:subtilisin family serine protease